MLRNMLATGLSLLLAATLTACSTGEHDVLKVVPSPESAQVQPSPPASPSAGDTLWNPSLVEETEIPGRVVGGVYYPAHREPVIVGPGGFRVKGDAAVPASAYAPGGQGHMPSKQAIIDKNSPPSNGPVPLVSAIFKNMPLGKALPELLKPLGFQTSFSPSVNTALPVSIRAYNRPLQMVLADMLGPYGYTGVIDLGRMEVRVD